MKLFSIFCTYCTTVLLLSLKLSTAHQQTALVSKSVGTGIKAYVAPVSNFFNGVWKWFQTSYLYHDLVTQGYTMTAIKLIASGFFGQSVLELESHKHQITKGKIVIRSNSFKEFKLEDLGCSKGNFKSYPPGEILENSFYGYDVENNEGATGIVCNVTYRDEMHRTFTITVNDVCEEYKRVYIQIGDELQSEVDIMFNESPGDIQFQVVVLLKDKKGKSIARILMEKVPYLYELSDSLLSFASWIMKWNTFVEFVRNIFY